MILNRSYYQPDPDFTLNIKSNFSLFVETSVYTDSIVYYDIPIVLNCIPVPTPYYYEIVVFLYIVNGYNTVFVLSETVEVTYPDTSNVLFNVVCPVTVNVPPNYVYFPD